MPCVGCPPPKEPTVQHAVRFRVVLSGGVTFEGEGPADWVTLRDKCFDERRFLLAGRVYFNDGTSRNFGGWSWAYMIGDGDNWTIDDDPSADRVLLKYRSPILIPGGSVFEAEMHEVNRLISEAA